MIHSNFDIIRIVFAKSHIQDMEKVPKMLLRKKLFLISKPIKQLFKVNVYQVI